MVHSSASPVNTHITSPGRLGISSPRGHPLDWNPKSNLDLLVILVLATQLCPTPCEPMDCSSPDSSVHGILQANILEWVAIPFSGDLPDPGIKSGSLGLAGRLSSEPGKLYNLSGPHHSHPQNCSNNTNHAA